MEVVKKYELTEDESITLKEISNIYCPELKYKDCLICPLYVDVNINMGANEDNKMCLSLLAQRVVRRSHLDEDKCN